MKRQNLESAEYAKVKEICAWVKRAREQDAKSHRRGWFYLHDVQWVWVDTCCIDKRSSAELSEAINSMWKWYENAEYCMAYLADIEPQKFKTDNDVR